MPEAAHRASNIITFPVRRRPADSTADTKSPASLVPRVVASSAWYHELAVETAGHGQS
jgi:hypothetical protein